MGIQNFPAALQPIIQQGFLDREFEMALKSRLGYRLVADREEFSVGIGETLTKTRAGLKPSITTPLSAANNTNLDNGLTSTTWGVEQYTISLNFYAATQDLNMVTSRVGIASQFTIALPTIGLNSLPATVTINAAISLSGSVSPGNSAVRVGLSASASTAPTSWSNAAVSNGAWTASLSPATAGTAYVWAQQTAATTVQAISSAIAVVTASLTVSAGASGAAGTALGVSGTVSPAADAVSVQLSIQNVTVPASGWSAATNSAGNFSASLTPAAAGTYYAWAQDSATGLTAVSAAITVAAAPSVTLGINNPGGSYAHGSGTIPLNGSITPAQDLSLQVALATSNTVAPSSGWQAAVIIDNNELWAVYANTPATAGNYYVWIETTSGGNQTVGNFTISVT